MITIGLFDIITNIFTKCRQNNQTDKMISYDQFDYKTKTTVRMDKRNQTLHRDKKFSCRNFVTEKITKTIG